MPFPQRQKTHTGPPGYAFSLDPAFHERTLFKHTRIHCMASSQEARNKWLAVLHRAGVHLHGEMEDGSIRRVRQGVPQAV